MKSIIVLIALLLGAIAEGQCNPPCPASAIGCCDTFFSTGQPSPPASFSQQCYVGNGSDNRKIPTGIHQSGLVMVYKVDADADATDATYRTDTSGGGDASCIIGGAGTSTCGVANRIQAFGDGYFEVGTDDAVNSVGDSYCWFDWGLSEHFVTFTWTGDGSSPRNIPLPPGFVPDAAMVQLDGGGGCFGASRIYMRTRDMPLTFSYGWYNVGESPRTNVITSLGTEQITVGACANENNMTYRAWAWESAPGYGDIIDWTGDGDSGSSCAHAGDQQVIATAGSPKAIITVGCQGNSSSCGAQGLACIAEAHTGVAPLIRGTNMGSAVSGPGHMPDDFISIFATGGRYGSVLGNLAASSFTVAGDGSFAQNLNDLGLLPYSWVTYQSNAIPGTTSPADWCFDPDTVACYANNPDDPGGIDFPFGANNDCSTGALSGGTILCGNTTCDCNLTQDGVTADTVNKVIGQQSAAYVAADNDFMSCAAGTCSDEFNLGQSGASFTVLGFMRATLDADMTFLNKNGTTANEYTMTRTASGDVFGCGVKNTGGTVISDGVAGFTTSDYHFGACVFDNTANTIEAYFDGAFSGSPGSILTDAQGGSGDFCLGCNGTVGAVTGNTNMMAIVAKPITSTDLCRALACGWNGRGCQCWDIDPTIYIDTGAYNLLGNGCTLPACNKNGPS